MSQASFISGGITLTLEEAVSLPIDVYQHWYKNMRTVWIWLERWQNYEVERKYRVHKNVPHLWHEVPVERIETLTDDELFMYLCFVLLSEDRWPFE